MHVIYRYSNDYGILPGTLEWTKLSVNLLSYIIIYIYIKNSKKSTMTTLSTSVTCVGVWDLSPIYTASSDLEVYIPRQNFGYVLSWF